MKRFEDFNALKEYSDQIKPLNFLLGCHFALCGHPTGADLDHFHLMAPYETDPRKWLNPEPHCPLRRACQSNPHARSMMIGSTLRSA